MAAAVPATFVSLFSGAGGLDVGLERAGWHTVVATDFDRDCVETLRRSQEARVRAPSDADRCYLEGAAIIQSDIADLTAETLRPAGSPRNWRPALVAGGPPCQPWSSAGLQKGFADPRGRLVDHFMRLVSELRPHFVLMENVRGLVTAIGPSGKPGEALELIQRSLEEIGYASAVSLLNAADYGAAQRRVRLILVASSHHRLPEFPSPTHQANDEMTLLDDSKPWVSLRELLATLPSPAPEDVIRPRGERARQLAALPPGTGLRTAGRVESNRPGGHWGYRQDCFVAELSLPSRTIRAASTPDWIREPDGSLRRLTWRECAALQGFPEGWQFTGTLTSRFRQIGNALQTTVAESMGRVLLAALADGPADESPESLPWPDEFHRRVRYTVSEHRVNREHRVRVRASV